MLEFLSFSALSGVAGALSVILVILRKADICPGQRGRLYLSMRWILLLLMPTALLSSSQVQALTLLGLLFLCVFFSKEKKAKTHNQSNLVLLYGAYFSLLVAFICLLLVQNWQINLLLISQFFLLAACVSHWILVKSRSRLQAFNRILPIVGIISAMLMTLILAIVAKNETLVPQRMLMPLLGSFGLMLAGFFFWVLPIVKNQALKQWHLHFVVILEFVSCVTALSLA